jgi:hypothetical protein
LWIFSEVDVCRDGRLGGRVAVASAAETFPWEAPLLLAPLLDETLDEQLVFASGRTQGPEVTAMREGLGGQRLPTRISAGYKSQQWYDKKRYRAVGVMAHHPNETRLYDWVRWATAEAEAILAAAAGAA